MKKLTFLLFLISYSVFSQIDGINYQSVIIDPETQEIPGIDVTGNVLINQEIEIRFTIISSALGIEYSEIKATRTDAFGMINVNIGKGIPEIGRFNDIVWDGSPKDLKVEIKIPGRSFVDQEERVLLFIPYALHRDIIVTKEMIIEGDVSLKGDLLVEGNTFLNDELNVNNQSSTVLNGNLKVDGITTLNDSLLVANVRFTHLSGTLDVAGLTFLEDSLQVNRNTLLKSDLTVENSTNLFGSLSVFNESPTQLTGSLSVNGISNIQNDVFVNNESDVNVSGDFSVQGLTILNNDLEVNGLSNFNNDLIVNNNSPTNLTGTLSVEGPSRVEANVSVLGSTNLDGSLNVNGQSSTQLSGTLEVDEVVNLNNNLNVNNNTPTNLSGDLTVGGAATFNEDVTINGVTNLNNNLFVNNNANTQLSGVLIADGATSLNNNLGVFGATQLLGSLLVNQGSPTNLSGSLGVTEASVFNDVLSVLNSSSTSLSGTLTVDQDTALNDDLIVANASAANLSGTLNVNQQTVLNNELSVLNSSPTTLSGRLSVLGSSAFNSTFRVNNAATTYLSGEMNVDGITILENDLTVAIASPTNLSGTLTVDGQSFMGGTLTISGATLIQNDLTVTQNAIMPNLFTTALTIADDQAGSVAVFENTNEGTTGAESGDGILIQLGRTHGAYNGPAGTNNPGDYLQVSNPYLALYQSQITAVGNLITTTDPSGSSIDVNAITGLIPANLVAGQFGSVGNSIIGVINNQLGLPVSTPEIAVPRTVIIPETTIFSGTNEICSGQYCFNPCTFFDCTVCIPPVAFCVPALQRIYIPEITMPRTTLVPPINNIVPAIPQGIPNIGSGDAILTIPNVTFGLVSNSMSKENTFMGFEDFENRQTGAIVAQSTADFLDNTILDQVYVINVLAGFVGVDLVEGLVGAGVEMSNLIDAFNKIGVSYESGHGDYAEWLPRANVFETISAGDIVAIKGGKITKDLTNFEQILVVSHKPIVLGNEPELKDLSKGNPVAFLGQVPVKVLGPVTQGDYIVADTTVQGYGKAVSKETMNTSDFQLAVGRAWETNSNEGPKLVRIVMGVHNGDWSNEIKLIQKQQNQLENTIESLEEKLKRISEKLNTISPNQEDYATTENE